MNFPNNKKHMSQLKTVIRSFINVPLIPPVHSYNFFDRKYKEDYQMLVKRTLASN